MKRSVPSSLAPIDRSIFAPRYRLIYGLILVGLAMLFFAGSRIYRQWLDDYQYNKERYAAERALDALEQGDEVELQEELYRLAEERPIGTTEGLLSRQFSEVTEGPVLRNRVQIYEELTARLLNEELIEEAEAVGWKALLEYHIVSRTLEMLIPWNLMYHIKALRGEIFDRNEDWNSVYEIAKILAGHGVGHIKPPGQQEAVPMPVDDELFAYTTDFLPTQVTYGLKYYYESRSPQEYQRALRTLNLGLEMSQSPVIRRRLRETIHELLVDSGEREEGRRLLGQAWGRDPEIMDAFWESWPQAPGMNLLDRDPTLLGMLWRDRPQGTQMLLTQFLDSFYGDPRLQVNNLRELELRQTGYFSPENNFMISGDEIVFFQNVAASIRIRNQKPVRRIYLAYEATPALGIYPILLLKINDQPYMPIYLNSEEPDLIAIDVDLDLEENYFEFVYLNDSGFVWPPRRIKEDRNFSLFRMVLVHVAPTEE